MVPVAAPSNSGACAISSTSASFLPAAVTTSAAYPSGSPRCSGNAAAGPEDVPDPPGRTRALPTRTYALFLALRLALFVTRVAAAFVSVFFVFDAAAFGEIFFSAT
jgi:hypothetical protein